MAPLFKRRPRRYRLHLFDDLPFEARRDANSRYWRYCQEWEGDLPGWRRAILIGQARRWAMTSEEERSQWGRSMLAKQGGYAVQRLYREQGRVGNQHPAHKAAIESARRRKDRQGKQPVQKMSIASKCRHRFLPIG